MQRAGGIVCFASVRDRFGDYGRVALATLRPPPPLAQSCLLLSHTIWDFLGERQRQEEAAHSTLGTDGSETDACLCSALLHHPVLTLEVSVASASLLFPLSSFLFPWSSRWLEQDWSRSRLDRGWSACQVVGIVDIFTMSCRALGRGVEHALLSEVARQARSLTQAMPRMPLTQGSALTEARPLKSSSASSASSRAATPSLPPAQGLLLFRYKTRLDLRNAVTPCRLATGVRRVTSWARRCY